MDQSPFERGTVGGEAHSPQLCLELCMHWEGMGKTEKASRGFQQELWLSRHKEKDHHNCQGICETLEGDYSKAEVSHWPRGNCTEPVPGLRRRQTALSRRWTRKYMAGAVKCLCGRKGCSDS